MNTSTGILDHPLTRTVPHVKVNQLVKLTNWIHQMWEAVT